jgi:hypothetical protein
MLRGAGMNHRKGYSAQAMPELAVKIRTTPSNSRITTKGMSHHFFSWRANFKNSLSSDHMSFLKLTFHRGSGNGEMYHARRAWADVICAFPDYAI